VRRPRDRRRRHTVGESSPPSRLEGTVITNPGRRLRRAGGAFVAWVTQFSPDVHVQHLISSTHLWPEGGAVVPAAPASRGALVADGAGGFSSPSRQPQVCAGSGGQFRAAQWKAGTNGGA
jgi:hypothetical protein